MGKWLMLGALLGLLGLAIWVAYQEWIAVDVALPGWLWAMIAFGVIISVLVGGGLTALLFYSSRMGYDEPPREYGREESERRRNLGA